MTKDILKELDDFLVDIMLQQDSLTEEEYDKINEINIHNEEGSKIVKVFNMLKQT